MGLFTIEVNFEIGRETRSMIERVATETSATIERLATTTMLVELGPETRETLEKIGLAAKQGRKAREAIEGLLGRGPEASEGD